MSYILGTPQERKPESKKIKPFQKEKSAKRNSDSSISTQYRSSDSVSSFIKKEETPKKSFSTKTSLITSFRTALTKISIKFTKKKFSPEPKIKNLNNLEKQNKAFIQNDSIENSKNKKLVPIIKKNNNYELSQKYGLNEKFKAKTDIEKDPIAIRENLNQPIKTNEPLIKEKAQKKITKNKNHQNNYSFDYDLSTLKSRPSNKPLLFNSTYKMRGVKKATSGGAQDFEKIEGGEVMNVFINHCFVTNIKLNSKCTTTVQRNHGKLLTIVYYKP